MKKLITIGMLFLYIPITNSNPVLTTDDPTNTPENTNISIDTLIQALIEVESGNNPRAIGDNGMAVGILQIWPITVKDVNRIQKRNGSNKRFTLDDRFDPDRSIQMFHIWKNHYHQNSNWEKISRCWNGGPRGMEKTSTIIYWKKVKRALNEISNDLNIIIIYT